MNDDNQDEILELTADMTSEEEAEEESVEGEKREEPEADEVEDRPAPPRPSSPFTLLVEPRKEKRPRESSPGPKSQDDAPRPSFIPSPNAEAVVTVPIKSLGGGEGVAPSDEFDGSDPEDGDSPREAEETADPGGDEAASEAGDEGADGDGDDEILDLGQEFVVGKEEASEEEAKEEGASEEEAKEEEAAKEEAREEVPIALSTPKASSTPPVPPAAASSTPPAPPAEAVGENVAVDVVEGAAEEEGDEPPIELGDAHVVDEGAKGEGGDDSVEHPFDFGTPEMVFDADESKEEIEELDDSELEEEPSEEEEIDLEEAEDLTELKPMSETFLARAAAKGKKRPGRRRRRRAKREWWSKIFDDDFLAILPSYSKRDTRKEIDFILESLRLPSGGLVLDLACGNGRHAVALAKRNYRVVGVDLSLSMLARAGELAQEAEQKINFIHGDMRDLGFDRTFDGVYCLGTSLGFFDEQTNAKVLEGVYKALKPGASLLIQVANRDFAITKQPNLLWFEMEDAICMEETDFNYINSRLYVTRQLILNNGTRQSKHEYSVRLYSLHEIGQMLHAAGFAVTKVSGQQATKGAFFGADSPNIYIVAERRR